MNIKKLLLFILMMGSLIPSARAEFLEEIYILQKALAIRNRQLLNVYAVTFKALDRKCLPMPKHIQEKGQALASIIPKEEIPLGRGIDLEGSMVWLRREKGFIVFDISVNQPFSGGVEEFLTTDVPFKEGKDPISEKIEIILEIKTTGMFFLKKKNKTQIFLVNPEFCYKTEEVFLFCKDFFVDERNPTRFFAYTKAELVQDLISKAGTDGVLTRKQVYQWYLQFLKHIEALIAAAKEGKGVIIPNEKGDLTVYQAPLE